METKKELQKGKKTKVSIFHPPAERLPLALFVPKLAQRLILPKLSIEFC
jgi:hypothetical protein